MTQRKDSPALSMIRLVYDTNGHGMYRSWTRYEAALDRALLLAIECGLRFDMNDFVVLDHDFIFTCDEAHYSSACAVTRRYGPNITAARAFERWKKRKPFLIQAQPAHVTRYRLAVGSQFRWFAEPLTVTSFAEDGTYLTACSYKDDFDAFDNHKVKHRRRITHADIQEYHAALRDRKRASKPAGGG